MDSQHNLFDQWTGSIILFYSLLFTILLCTNTKTLFLIRYASFSQGSCYSSVSFICMFCRSLFLLLSFFFWQLCCLVFFDLRILITPLVSSNSSNSVYMMIIINLGTQWPSISISISPSLKHKANLISFFKMRVVRLYLY
jgi:hypothetical protein